MPMYILESNDRIVKSRNEGIEFQLWDIVFGQTILAACWQGQDIVGRTSTNLVWKITLFLTTA